MASVCGTCFPSHYPGVKQYKDDTGCILENCIGKHRFVDANTNQLIEWEDDDHCSCCSNDPDGERCVLIRDVSNEVLRKPELTNGSLSDPKALIAYLKAGCEIRQVGFDGKPGSSHFPEHFLLAPNAVWQVRVKADHVNALETLGLLQIDSQRETEWLSRLNVSLPTLQYDIPEV